MSDDDVKEQALKQSYEDQYDPQGLNKKKGI